MIRTTARASILIAVFSLSACESEQATAEHLSFEIVDSLLSPVQPLELSQMTFRPPIGFQPVPDSLLATLGQQLETAFGPRENVSLRKAFVDQAHGAGILVSMIAGLHRQGDTAAFMDGYRQRLLEAHGAEDVNAGDFWVDSIYVKNFLISDSIQVRFQLICFAPVGDAVELQYVAPRATYQMLVKRFESSIGTLKSVKGGG